MTHRRWPWLAAALIWAAVILAMSSVPAPELPPPPPFPHHDKLLHFAEYAVLGALLGRRFGFAAAAVAAAGFGAADELWQSFVPGRDSSVFDGLADAAGATLGAYVGRRRV